MHSDFFNQKPCAFFSIYQELLYNLTWFEKKNGLWVGCFVTCNLSQKRSRTFLNKWSFVTAGRQFWQFVESFRAQNGFLAGASVHSAISKCMQTESEYINLRKIWKKKLTFFLSAIYTRNTNPKIKNWFRYSCTQHRLQKHTLITIL